MLCLLLLLPLELLMMLPAPPPLLPTLPVGHGSETTDVKVGMLWEYADPEPACPDTADDDEAEPACTPGGIGGPMAAPTAEPIITTADGDILPVIVPVLLLWPLRLISCLGVEVTCKVVPGAGGGRSVRCTPCCCSGPVGTPGVAPLPLVLPVLLKLPLRLWV